ncbi:MAG: glycoside hydrolase, partial [Alistipes sp.]|nr:glycoside hydrolase [Alistipes sp.]
PKERYETLRNFFNTYHNASPYMEKYVLEALCRMGYYEDALCRMERRFGEMVASEHTTLWEGWEYTGARGTKYKSGNGTYNHAWSGGGLTILSEFIAGIAPTSPAFKEFSVCPNLATLNYVNSIVPTVYGEITMSAKKSGNNLEISLTVPQGTQATILLPAGYKEIVTDSSKGDKLTLTAGKHNINIVG